jgi:hypothetical protein
MPRWGLLLASALLWSGCILDRQPETAGARPTDSPFNDARTAAMKQANVEACTRVFGLGQRILAANRDLPQRIVFRAAGSPDPEVFHQGTTSIIVTQKLVEMCSDDGLLAAVLCLELGKMVAEREALAAPAARQPQTRLPLEGVAFPGTAGVANPDPLRLNELAVYEQDQRRVSGKLYLPDPRELARKYLSRSGFPPEDLDRARPILRAAADHAGLETQLGSAPRAAPFAPP